MKNKNLLVVANSFPHKNCLTAGTFTKVQVDAIAKYFNKVFVICPTPYIPIFIARFQFIPATFRKAVNPIDYSYKRQSNNDYRGGILGTPAVRCNSWVGPNDMSNFIELEKKYDLIYSFRDPDKALELLKNPDLKQEWAKKREKLLNDKIDVTDFMIKFIENYPKNFKKYE